MTSYRRIVVNMDESLAVNHDKRVGDPHSESAPLIQHKKTNKGLLLTLTEMGRYQVVVRDIKGRIVLNRAFSAGLHLIKKSELGSGVRILTVKQKNSVTYGSLTYL